MSEEINLIIENIRNLEDASHLVFGNRRVKTLEGRNAAAQLAQKLADAYTRLAALLREQN